MNLITIYAAEASLKEVLQNNAIAYTTQLFVEDKPPAKLIEEVTAAQSDKQIDLHYIKTILVTADTKSGNLNGDWFLPDYTWAARNTPQHKPFNNNHDHRQIIGHITDNYVINDNGDVITEMEDRFHIVTSAVIYKYYREKDLAERSAELIEEILAGKKFVSMEAIFSDFDYMLEQADGSFGIVHRNEESAYLTKHLRCYGGKGEYEGKQLQRAIKDLVFSGKGLVDVPANPESVILETTAKSVFIPTVFTSNSSNGNILTTGSTNSKNSVYTSNEWKVPQHPIAWNGQTWTVQTSTSYKHIGNEMETIEILQKELAAARAEVKEANAKLAEGNVEAVKSQNSALAGKVEGLEKVVADLNTKVAELTTNLEAAKKEAKDEKEAKAALETSVASLTEKNATLESEKVTATRVAQLVEAGKTSEEAAAFAKKLAKADDETFAAFIETLAAWPPKKDEKKDEKKKEEAKADLSVLEVKEEKSADLGVATAAVDDLKSLDDAIAMLVTPYLKKKR